jgi:membrane-associated protease RseP (regulator of RpoE activity)
MYSQDNDIVTPIVSRYLKISDITWADPKKGYLVRYRGKFYDHDTASIYDKLQSDLKSLDITPLFRNENEQHAVILVKGVIQPKPSNIWINIILFILTLFSVMFTGALLSYDGPASQDFWQIILNLIRNIDKGIPFAASLLAILVAHEFGHYFAGRYHRTAVTLPYFLPFPLSYFGTMGAFIRLKEPPKNRRILLDIGIAGPLAGLVVAIPIVLLGLHLSPVQQIPYSIPVGQSFEGNSILYLILKYVVHGEWLPQPVSYAGIDPVLYWIRYFFTGLPLPRGGMDVTLHPIAWAGWAGLLVTALNLIPAGQLDGGHVLYVLLGKKTGKLLPVILILLLLLGMVWRGWWLWAFLIFFLGRFYAEPLDQITPLDKPRKAVALLGLLVFLLVFTPVPLIEIFGNL